jgi:hypothetical protein
VICGAQTLNINVMDQTTDDFLYIALGFIGRASIQKE